MCALLLINKYNFHFKLKRKLHLLNQIKNCPGFFHIVSRTKGDHDANKKAPKASLFVINTEIIQDIFVDL